MQGHDALAPLALANMLREASRCLDCSAAKCRRPCPSARSCTFSDLPRIRIDAGSWHGYITSEMVQAHVDEVTPAWYVDDRDSCMKFLVIEVTRQTITPRINVFQHCGICSIFSPPMSFFRMALQEGHRDSSDEVKHSSSTVAARSAQIRIVRSGGCWRAKVLGVLRLTRLGRQVKMLSVSDVDPSQGSACAQQSWAVQQALVTRAKTPRKHRCKGERGETLVPHSASEQAPGSSRK